MENENYFNDTFKELTTILSDYTDLKKEDINLQSRLSLDLGLTSFDFICLMAALEDNYGINSDNIINEDIVTVEDVYKLITSKDTKKVEVKLK